MDSIRMIDVTLCMEIEAFLMLKVMAPKQSLSCIKSSVTYCESKIGIFNALALLRSAFRIERPV